MSVAEVALTWPRIVAVCPLCRKIDACEETSWAPCIGLIPEIGPTHDPVDKIFFEVNPSRQLTSDEVRY